MARPPTNPEQKLVAYETYKVIGAKPSAIREKLVDKFGDGETASLRTISTWLAIFKSLDTSLDDPFEWNRLGDYEKNGFGVSWAAGEYLLGMWCYVWERISEWNRVFRMPMTRETSVGVSSDAPVGPLLEELEQFVPSVRDACWWWRLHQASPDLDEWRVWVLGHAYASREIARDVLNQPLGDVRDLDGYLAYRPWDGELEKKRYERAMNDGRVPALRDDRAELANARMNLSGEEAALVPVPGDFSFKRVTRERTN